MKKMLALTLCTFFIFANIATVLAKPLSEKISDEINTAPIISLTARKPKKPVDIVVVTDYTGQNLANLQAAINEAKAKLLGVNVDPVFHIVTDMKVIGKQKDKMYNWKRTAGVRLKFDARVSNTSYTSPYYTSDSEVIEEMEALLSDINKLPKRTPTNIRETHYEESFNENNGDRYGKRLIFNVYWNNDIRSHVGPLSITTELNGARVSNPWYLNSLLSITPFVTGWTPGDPLYNIDFDILSIDIDKVMSTPLRTGSDRFMLLVSDGVEKNYSNTDGNKGKFFSFGGLTEEFANYLKTNNITTLAVLKEGIGDMLLLDEKVKEIIPIGSATVFKMIDGSYKKLGGYINTTLGWAMLENYREVDKVKEAYMDGTLLMEDGRILIYDAVTDKFESYHGFTNVKNIYPRAAYDKLNNNIIEAMMIEDNSGRIYLYSDYISNYPNAHVGTVSSGIKIYKSKYILSNSNDIYVLMNYYTGPVKKARRGTKIYYSSYRYNFDDLPKVKKMVVFPYTTGYSYDNPAGNMTVLYEDGRLCRLVYYDSLTGPDDKLVEGPFFTEILVDTDVVELYDAGCVPFYKKSDGTYWVQGYRHEYRYSNREEEYVYEKSIPITPVQLNINIESIHETDHGVLFINASDGTYITKGLGFDEHPEELRKIGSFKVDYIKRLTSGYYALKTKNDNFYLVEFSASSSVVDLPYKYHGVMRSMKNLTFKIREIKNIYSSGSDISEKYPCTAIVLTDDGRVRGIGESGTGQIGKVGLPGRNVSEDFINPFYNILEFNNPDIKDITINNLLRDSLYNKSYGSQKYREALDDIYKRYSYNNSGVNYILLGESIEYVTEYSDYENDPEYQKKWSLAHDPNYFDNSMGLSIYHGKETQPPNTLDKVGKYVINLKARDNPKNDNRFDNYRLWSTGDQNLTLYVHRKPIALINVTVTQNPDETFRIVATDGGSYDLDHTSRADKGIVEWEWAWRDQWEDSWHYERMNRTDATGDRAYIIALRVKDMEGVWSDWVYQTIDNRQPPIAKFDIAKNPITSVETAQIIDTSYGIMSSLTDWHWIVKRINDNGSIGATLQDIRATSSNTGAGGYDTTLDITRTNPGLGYYRIYLRVKADNGLWSDGGTDVAANINNMFYRDITVISANEPPTVFLTKTPQFVYEGDTVKIIINPSDPDEDLLQVQLEEKVDSGSYRIVLNQSNVPSDITVEYVVSDIAVGDYEYKATVTDPDGETATANLSFTVHEIGIVGQVNHTDLWNQNRIKYNQSKTGTDDSPRAYSVFFPGERFVLRADTTLINPLSNVEAEIVTAVIQGTTFSDTLTLRPGEKTIWDGYIWDASMIGWNNRTLNFIFSVRYSNGKIKQHIVPVTIDDDKYWRLKLKF